MTRATAMPHDSKSALTPNLRFPEFRDGPGWDTILLKSVCQMQAGKFVQASDIGESLKAGLFPCYGGNGLRGYTKTFTHSGKYPLIGRQGALCGNVKLVAGDFHATEHAVVATARHGIDVDWLFYTLELANLNQYATGQAQPGLSVDVLDKVSVALPPKPAEQQKIAECLSSLDELIGAERQKLDALKAHKKGLMQQLFPREGETLPRLRFPEFKSAPEWEKKSVGDLGDVVTGNTPKTAKREYYNGDIPFVSPVDVSDLRYVDITKTTLTELGFQETRPIRAGSVVFVCIGSTIGKVAQIRRNSATNQQINSIIPNSDHDDDFVYYVLAKNSDRVAALAGRHAVPIVNKSLFESVGIRVPKQNEQRRIATCLTSLDDLISAQNDRLAALKNHKQGLLQQLFPSPADSDA